MYRVTNKETKEILKEFTHHHLAERYCKMIGNRDDFAIHYVKKEDEQFSREDMVLFDHGILAYKHDNFDMSNRR